MKPSFRTSRKLKAVEQIDLLTEQVSPVHQDPRSEVLRLRETMQDIKAIRVEECTVATLFRRVFKVHWLVENNRVNEIKARARWTRPGEGVKTFWMTIGKQNNF